MAPLGSIASEAGMKNGSLLGYKEGRWRGCAELGAALSCQETALHSCCV